MNLHRFTKHATVCVVFFALGIASTVAYNHVASRHDVVFRNAVDSELTVKLLGAWSTDDLRTDAVESTTTEFKTSGEMISEDNNFLRLKWTSMNGLIYVSSKRIDGVQPNWKGLPDPVIPVFNDTADQVTLAYPGREPFARLTRKRT